MVNGTKPTKLLLAPGGPIPKVYFLILNPNAREIGFITILFTAVVPFSAIILFDIFTQWHLIKVFMRNVFDGWLNLQEREYKHITLSCHRGF